MYLPKSNPNNGNKTKQALEKICSEIRMTFISLLIYGAIILYPYWPRMDFFLLNK